MPVSSGDKLCPICDSPLQPGSKKCSFCGTDLSIFDIEMEEPKKPQPAEAPPPPQRVSLEARVQEVLSRPSAQEKPAVRQAPPPAEPPKPEPRPSIVREVRGAPPPRPEPKPSPPPEPVPEPEPVVEEKKVEYFECPQCGSNVEFTATSCPKCGVLFAEEGADMFECPACNTLVKVDAQSCPGCGAMFVEAEEEPAAAPPAPTPTPMKPAVEEPIEEVEPPPKKEEKPASEPEKKGLFGRFKWKKEEAEPVAEKPVAEEVPPKPAPAPKKVSEVQIREVQPEKPAVAKAPPPEPVVAPVPHRPAPTPAPGAPAVKDKGRDLARMVAEMKPLLALAREKEVDIGESKTLIDDAAVAGRERRIDKAIELVQSARTILMGKIDAHLGTIITRLNEEIKVAREFGGDISRATTYIQEVARARSSGDVEAAYVYIDKIEKEMQPITGRYNDSRKKITSLKQFIADCEVFIVDTREARKLLLDANRAFEAKDFDKVDSVVRSATETLYKNIPARMNEEMKKAKDELLEAKVRNVNITPMLTVLKSATNLMKSGDYGQAIKEMREFKEMLKKPA